VLLAVLVVVMLVVLVVAVPVAAALRLRAVHLTVLVAVVGVVDMHALLAMPFAPLAAPRPRLLVVLVVGRWVRGVHGALELVRR
jgi:hypothetical protein